MGKLIPRSRIFDADGFPLGISMPRSSEIVALEVSWFEKKLELPEKWVKLAWFFPRNFARRRFRMRKSSSYTSKCAGVLT